MIWARGPGGPASVHTAAAASAAPAAAPAPAGNSNNNTTHNNTNTNANHTNSQNTTHNHIITISMSLLRFVVLVVRCVCCVVFVVIVAFVAFWPFCGSGCGACAWWEASRGAARAQPVVIIDSNGSVIIVIIIIIITNATIIMVAIAITVSTTNITARQPKYLQPYSSVRFGPGGTGAALGKDALPTATSASPATQTATTCPEAETCPRPRYGHICCRCDCYWCYCKASLSAPDLSKLGETSTCTVHVPKHG